MGRFGIWRRARAVNRNSIDSSAAKPATLVRDLGKAWGGSDSMSLRPRFFGVLRGSSGSSVMKENVPSIIPALGYVVRHPDRHYPTFSRHTVVVVIAAAISQK
jgi:hypothetical protein